MKGGVKNVPEDNLNAWFINYKKWGKNLPCLPFKNKNGLYSIYTPERGYYFLGMA